MALPAEVVARLDLPLAWQRVKRDLDRAFVRYPYLEAWIEEGVQPWLDELSTSLLSGFIPTAALIADVPKGSDMVRPGSVLSLRDQVVFAAVVGDFYSAIKRTIGNFQGDPDIAYPLSRRDNDIKWTDSGFEVWRQWREKSSEKLTHGVQFMVSADISGFYENVDFQRLSSELRATAVDPELLSVLSNCLNTWASARGKGIPQALSASHILAKLYLHPMDHALRNAGIVHLRYVDDIRIFCSSGREARLALLKLQQVVRSRGLNLQNAKTEILSINDARSKVDGVSPVIMGVQDQLKEAILAEVEEFGEYVNAGAIEEYFSKHPEEVSVDVLDEAFRDFFLGTQPFSKSLFHYLLTRLGRAGSAIAVEYCLAQLRLRPEETEDVLRYLDRVTLSGEQVDLVISHLASPDAIFDYQSYQIMRWLLGKPNITEIAIGKSRAWAFDRNKPQWLRVWCMAFLESHGNVADIDEAENQYANTTDEIERASIIMSLRNAELTRRNAFYNRVRNDGELVRRAVLVARRVPHVRPNR